MKIGNISQTVLNRSVLKQLHTVREEVLFAPSAGETCTVVRPKEGQDIVFASASVSGNSKSVGIYAVVKAVTDLETRGAQAIGVSVQVFLPEYAYESRLKEMFRRMEEKCAQLNVQITGADVQTSPAVTQSVVTVTATGAVEQDRLLRCQDVRPGMDLVLCGYIGLEGMLRILDERREELGRRFTPAFLHQMQELEGELEHVKALRQAVPKSAAMQQIGSGGIFAALWELTEAAQVGMKVELSRMSIRQETVEVCEHYLLNPYQMTSAGSVLIASENGSEIVRILEEGGARASLLGVTTGGKDRVITSGEEIRYLDRPQPDELMRWWSQQPGKEPE